MGGGDLTTHPLGPASLWGLLGGLVGGGQRGRQGPPRREGRQCPGEALECGRALEGRRAQRDLLFLAIMQQGQRTGTEYIISCPSSSPLCGATERTLWRLVTHSLKNSHSQIQSLQTGYTQFMPCRDFD